MSNVFGTINPFNLDVTNNINAGNIIMAETMQATNGNFTNLTGTVTPGQLLVQHVETTRDSETMVVGSNLSSLTNNSRGVHVGFDAFSGQSSIYCCNNSEAIGELYLNMPFSLPNGGVHADKIYVDKITEETTTNGVVIMDSVTVKNNEITTSDSFNISANGVTNNTLRLQSLGVSGVEISPTQVAIGKPVDMGGNSLTMNGGSVSMFGGTINVNGAIMAQNYFLMNAGAQDTMHVETITNGSSGWIAGSFGGPNAVARPRIVMGALDVGGQIRPTLGVNVLTPSVGYTAWDRLYINPLGGVNIGADITTLTSASLNIGGSTAIQGDVDISGTYKVNGTPISVVTWKELSGSRYVTSVVGPIYQTMNVITWNGVFSGIPTSTAMSITGNGIGELQYRVTNFDQSIVFFESPIISFNTGIARVFTSNVVTPITGATSTTPLIFQARSVSGFDFDVWSQSVIMS